VLDRVRNTINKETKEGRSKETKKERNQKKRRK
jgi:hypothetical protein